MRKDRSRLVRAGQVVNVTYLILFLSNTRSSTYFIWEITAPSVWHYFSVTTRDTKIGSKLKIDNYPSPHTSEAVNLKLYWIISEGSLYDCIV